MKGQRCAVVNMLIIELDQRFVDFKLMINLGIVYPQFWMELDEDLSFFLHMVVIKKHYCEAKRVKPSLLQVAESLDVDIQGACESTLMSQSSIEGHF